jgi:hypothetical protein
LRHRHDHHSISGAKTVTRNTNPTIKIAFRASFPLIPDGVEDDIDPTIGGVLSVVIPVLVDTIQTCCPGNAVAVESSRAMVDEQVEPVAFAQVETVQPDKSRVDDALELYAHVCCGLSESPYAI